MQWDDAMLTWCADCGADMNGKAYVCDECNTEFCYACGQGNDRKCLNGCEDNEGDD